MVNRNVESAKATSSLERRRPGSSSDGIVVKKEEKGGGRTDAAFQKSFYESHM